MIGLHDADKTGFPNLALMKLSAYYKKEGEGAEMWRPGVEYDHVFSSKVFTFTEETAPPGAILGGFGRLNKLELPNVIEHTCPDYSLYGLDYSLGFLTRGCCNHCPPCFVPMKEGGIRAHTEFKEFVRHDKAVFMDNNVLACEHGISQIEQLAETSIKVDFNQGLDSRRIDNATARLLKKLKWLHPVRLACDSHAAMDSVFLAVKNLRRHNVTPGRYFCYVLVQDIEDALERIEFLKTLWIDPFAQPYIPPDGTPPTEEQGWFARWVNMKAEFKTQTWEEYRERMASGLKYAKRA